MGNYWTVPRVWNGRCFILGGGCSLKGFPFEKLRDKRVVGCNDAYLLGSEICNYICFGDEGWYYIHKNGLRKYTGIIVSNNEKMLDKPEVFVCKRLNYQIGTEERLGWFFNTGCLATNLAISLGADEIILLGFDMKLTGNRSNWYENLKDKPNPKVYHKFLKWWKRFKSDLNRDYPEVKIYNTSMDSDMDLFPKRKWSDFL